MEKDEEQRVSKKERRDSPMPSDERSRLAGGPVVSKYLTSILDEIMEDLTQPNTITLGVTINGDVKLEVAQIINERVERDGVFDAIMMASVTEHPNMKRIQEELGNKLDLQFNEITTRNQRATLLCDKIKTKDKVLIILDDLHRKIDLADIGIPFGDDHKGCKFLLLAPANIAGVLLYDMKCQRLYDINTREVYGLEPPASKVEWGEAKAGGSNDRERSESVKANLNEIIEALKTQFIVGLYGSSDARKREMVEQITRRAERDGGVVVNVKANAVKKEPWLFWSNKSLDVNSKFIQGKLANELGLQLHDKTSSQERATRLCDTIKTKENILIIIYDLQGRIDLGKIGIPFENNHKGCKIMFVAETQDVLYNQNSAPQIKFSVDD